MIRTAGEGNMSDDNNNVGSDKATTESYTISLHDDLPMSQIRFWVYEAKMSYVEFIILCSSNDGAAR